MENAPPNPANPATTSSGTAAATVVTASGESRLAAGDANQPASVFGLPLALVDASAVQIRAAGSPFIVDGAFADLYPDDPFLRDE